MNIRIVACGVFESALTHLNFDTRFPAIEIEYLPPHLHNYPFQIQSQLDKIIPRIQEKKEKIICLYGKCFPEIDEYLKERGARRPACDYCYEMLMGLQSFRMIIEKDPRTYFAEKELVMNFDEYCRKPLELDDPQMRNWFFERYRNLLYIQQPEDPPLLTLAESIADFLHLNLLVEKADYRDLAHRLEKEIQKIPS